MSMTPSAHSGDAPSTAVTTGPVPAAHLTDLVSLTLTADRSNQQPGREQLYAFAAQVAALTAEGDNVDGEPFVRENDDAWATLNQLIAAARELLHTFQDCAGTAKGCRMAQPAPSPDRLSKKEGSTCTQHSTGNPH